jgi:hypothetical protein|tara:strand:- start:40127 stop:41380 length:1254 start_codon:yes stop_codon:yes gene_type:complete
MKKLLFFLLPFLVSALFAQQNKNVLFIGNSYTYYNNMPQMLSQMANSTGDNINTDSSTPGGYTLNGHTTNAATLQKIQGGGWDFVVLQEQSQLPSFPIGQVQTDCFPYASQLDSMINAVDSCTETMFYMTWGRKNGDASNCGFWPPVCTYEGMDDLLRQRYDQMAVDNHGVLSPVGALWRYIRNNDSTIELYNVDESHPSLAGSYAAACSFYTTILRKDPTLIADDQGLSAAYAQFIRNAAKAVVFDSLLTWHVGEYDPVASFTPFSQINNLTAQFSNLSTNANSYYWNFGDGSTSTDVNPSHTYFSVGTFIVQLIAENCGLTDTTYQNVIIALTDLDENKMLPIEMSPNPITDILTLQLKNADEIVVYDEAGKTIELIIKESEDTYELNFTNQSQGLYFIKVKKDGKVYSGKVLKE